MASKKQELATPGAVTPTVQETHQDFAMPDAQPPAVAETPETQPAFVAGALDPAAPALVEVKVKADARWSSIQSAGTTWSTVATRINGKDPRLAELRANPYLEVTNVTEE